ncbi:MAG: hypothetical protein BJ554DRAFT_4434, partial [Olpidium bornovanus]
WGPDIRDNYLLKGFAGEGDVTGCFLSAKGLHLVLADEEQQIPTTVTGARLFAALQPAKAMESQTAHKSDDIEDLKPCVPMVSATPHLVDRNPEIPGSALWPVLTLLNMLVSCRTVQRLHDPRPGSRRYDALVPMRFVEEAGRPVVVHSAKMDRAADNQLHRRKLRRWPWRPVVNVQLQIYEDTADMRRDA